jgi:hypothetical protein
MPNLNFAELICAYRIAGFVSTVTQIALGLSLAILEG